MTTQNATVAPPSTTAARRYSQQITSLVDVQTREYLLGLAILAAEAGGYNRPREASEVRDLLDEAIAARYRKRPDEYEAAVRRGRRELADREAEAERRKVETSGRVEAVTAPPA